MTLLSLVARSFDSLDIVTSFIMSLKLLYQRVWQMEPSVDVAAVALSLEELSVSLVVVEVQRVVEVERYSSWTTASCVVAWVMRFVQNAQVSAPQRSTGDLAAVELKKAEWLLLRLEQQMMISFESKGVLEFSKLAYGSKHPVLLPKGELRALHEAQERLMEVFWHAWSTDYLRNLPSAVSQFRSRGVVRPGSVVMQRWGECYGAKDQLQFSADSKFQFVLTSSTLDLVLLHFLYFLTYSFWKSSIPLGITDSCEMALIRRARESIWKLSQLEEETVEQVLTSIEPSSPAHPPKLSFDHLVNGQRKDTMKQVGGHSHADGNSKRSTPVHQSKTEINFISTNELCADLTFVSGLCMFASTIHCHCGKKAIQNFTNIPFSIYFI
ncbi:hypothetical protein CAPTEDRAFT_197720 [Capitella teleta]|uniref:Uncharacterized protein n=1 Tax=Capitella teleta TaxID=283909 RepID=R7TYR1_CAPTE|nr:hypothetical protein CAPTEDRAFT_197720 [Capitella teleta]|eukprot:ELT99063.1 hypothetical protein CAPTEDRAFT_197720 [Capitella teleta]